MQVNLPLNTQFNAMFRQTLVSKHSLLCPSPLLHSCVIPVLNPISSSMLKSYINYPWKKVNVQNIRYCSPRFNMFVSVVMCSGNTWHHFGAGESSFPADKMTQVLPFTLAPKSPMFDRLIYVLNIPFAALFLQRSGF